MGYILDLALLVIVIVSAIIYHKRGFIRTAIELCGFILAGILAFNFGPTLSQVTYDKAIKPAVEQRIEETIDSTIDSATESVSEGIWEVLPDFVVKNADSFGLSEDMINNSISNAAPQDTGELAASITDTVVTPIAVSFLEVVYSIIIFAVLCFVFKFLAKPLNKLCSFSIIGKINHILGGVLGAGKGIIYCIVICFVVSSFVVFTKSGFLIFTRENIENSAIFELLCKINPLYK